MEFDLYSVLVAALTWVLTLGAGKVIDLSKYPRMRHILPLVAMVLATGLQSALAVWQGADAFSAEVLLTGLSTGAVAIASHSQGREILKLIAELGKPLPEENPTE